MRGCEGRDGADSGGKTAAGDGWWVVDRWRCGGCGQRRRDTKRVNRESTCKQATRETNNVGAAGCSPNEAARLSPVRSYVLCWHSCVLRFRRSAPSVLSPCRIYRISAAASAVPARRATPRAQASIVVPVLATKTIIARSIRNRFGAARFKASRVFGDPDHCASRRPQRARGRRRYIYRERESEGERKVEKERECDFST